MFVFCLFVNYLHFSSNFNNKKQDFYIIPECYGCVCVCVCASAHGKLLMYSTQKISENAMFALLLGYIIIIIIVSAFCYSLHSRAQLKVSKYNFSFFFLYFFNFEHIFFCIFCCCHLDRFSF